MDIMAYALTTYYVKSIDKLGLLDQLVEDDYFGNFTFLVDNKKISRDLLDSITEIYFLEKHLNVSSLVGLKVLDIGAGHVDRRHDGAGVRNGHDLAHARGGEGEGHFHVQATAPFQFLGAAAAADKINARVLARVADAEHRGEQ